MTKIHNFDTTGEAYDACQCDDDINTGDVLVIDNENVVGLAWVWPFALTENSGKLHTLEPDVDPLTFEDGKFAAGVLAARAIIAERPAVPAPKITLYFSTVDGSNTVKRFDTVEAARAVAYERVGEHPTFGGGALGSGYAISDDGVVKVEAYGVLLTELFPEAS